MRWRVICEGCGRAFVYRSEASGLPRPMRLFDALCPRCFTACFRDDHAPMLGAAVTARVVRLDGDAAVG